MQLSCTNATAAVLWVLAMCAVGIALGMTSLTGWSVLAGLAFLPPLLIGRLWKVGTHDRLSTTAGDTHR